MHASLLHLGHNRSTQWHTCIPIVVFFICAAHADGVAIQKCSARLYMVYPVDMVRKAGYWGGPTPYGVMD